MKKKTFKDGKDYLPNTIGSWPRFTSTTKNYNQALNFGYQNGELELILFKIYLTNYNSPRTNVDLVGDDWAFYKSE